jgi:hypothetical protein
MYMVAGVIILFVIAQSVFFLARAWRRAKEIGFDVAKLRRVVTSSALFTIAPAVSILLGVIALSKFLGLPLPWLRLSVVGALTYEMPAALSAAKAMGTSVTQTVIDPQAYSTIAWVMTLGIIPGLIIIPIWLKKIQGGVIKIVSKDKRWGEIIMSALFLGMISAFLGLVFANVHEGLIGWVPVFIMAVSVLLMLVLGTLCKKYKIAWLENYALPFSMLLSMAASIPVTNWVQLLGGAS